MEEKEMHETQPASIPMSDPKVPETMPTKMHPGPVHKSKWLLLLVVGFLIIFISIYTFQFFTERSQQKQAATLTIISPSPISATNTSQNSTGQRYEAGRPVPLFQNICCGVKRDNWKTYIKDNFFSLRYPLEFKVTEKNNNSIQLTSTQSASVILINKKQLATEIPLDKANNEFSTCQALSHSQIKSLKKSVYLDYHQAIMIDKANCSSPDLMLVYGSNTSSKVLYEIAVSHYDDENVRLVNDILETFRFLYPSQDPSICSDEDQNFCDFKKKLQNLLDEKNFSALVNEQELESVTCTQNESGYPLPLICEGQLEGGVVYGYRILRNESEGGVFSQTSLLQKYKSYFDSSDLYLYQGYKRNNRNAVIVYTNQLQSSLFVISLEKKENAWKIKYVMDGIATTDFLTFNEQL